MFLYRDNELEILENEYIQPNATFSIVFGRYKVGKTELVKNYMKEKPFLYLCSYESTLNLLLANFKNIIENHFNRKIENEFTSLEEMVIFISNQDIKNKLVLVLEDIHHLIKHEKSFFKKMNNYWNKYLKSKNVQIVLTSSIYPSSKEDLLILKKFNSVIKLESLNFNIIKKYYPQLDKDTAMYVYSSFGTNPQYLKLYNPNKDFLSNIKENILSNDSFLYNEGFSIVKSELNDVITYCSILYAISMGNKKIGDIAEFLGLKSSYLTRYIQKLLDLMIIKKTVPLNEDISKSKFGRYEIEDKFLKFWFCYVYPNFSLLNKSLNLSVVEYIRKDFSSRLVQKAYVEYVKDLMSNEPEKFFDFIPNKFGSWWNNKDIEIDLIAYNSKNITFIDCKWHKNNNMKKNYELLQAKSTYFNTTLIKKYIIFSKNTKK